MVNKNEILAVIPARSGSKGLVNKNILNFNKKPLIAWTIEAALKSKYLDEVFVNSDCKKILKISYKYGANIPFVRPKKLSGDTTIAMDVILHSIKKINKEKKYKYILWLQPTSPLRNNLDIDNMIEEYFKRKYKIILSAKKSENPIDWTLKIQKDYKIKNYKNYSNIKNRQDYQNSFIPNGAMYFSDIQYLIKKRSFYTDSTTLFEMPVERSIDIDNLFDFNLAEYLMK